MRRSSGRSTGPCTWTRISGLRLGGHCRVVFSESFQAPGKWYRFFHGSIESLNQEPPTHLYVQELRYLFPLALVLSVLLIQAGTADHLTIGALPELPAIGDRVVLSGTTDAEDIIAVFLFVAGPGLDRRGVCLENLNLPAGHGYFTSAHVNPDRTWNYEWDTGYLAGRLIPGTYTLYVVNLPIGLPNSETASYAETNITFTRMPDPGLAPDILPLCIAGISGGAIIIYRRKKQ